MLSTANATAIHKNVGETPLEALERFRATSPDLKDAPMTYAGRLDPMAEGKLIILIGDECKHKEKYLGLDKEYEVEVVFGISTDTFDALGLSKAGPNKVRPWTGPSSYIGRFVQEYPPFSSKTVNGRRLHELARAGELPEEMPTKEVEIYSIELLSQGMISASELKTGIFGAIDKITGDFRQEEIKSRWADVLSDPGRYFEILKIRVRCSSGTYMRSLAHRMGEDRGCGAFALSINRTEIFG